MCDEFYDDANWREFEKTGSITAYLKYKGVYSINPDSEKNAISYTEVRDGEPIGYC